MSSGKRDADAAFEMPPDVDDEHCPKRMRSYEPDVCVIVGGEKFYHYGCILSNCSEYFNALLASNMKEGTTKVIEFKEKDPEEWKMVARFLEPSAAIHVDIPLEDMEVLVKWFSELEMTGFLSFCDRAVERFVEKQRQNGGFKKCLNSSSRWGLDTSTGRYTSNEANIVSVQEGKAVVEKVLEQAEFSVRYDLKYAIKECAATFSSVLDKCLQLLEDTQSIVRLSSLVKNEEMRAHLLPSIKKMLPDEVPEMKEEDLVDSPLLVGAIALKVKNEELVFKSKR